MAEHPKDSRFIDITGRRIGRLVVVEYLGRRGRRHWWRCACDCGGELEVERGNLGSGRVNSCGCLRREVALARMQAAPERFAGQPIHGLYGTATYRSWAAMIQRCTNPERDNYSYYGGRGIKVCDRWRVFENFVADMGLRPPGRTIGRIDNDGDYEPGNCRWETMKIQSGNRRPRGSSNPPGQ